MGERVVIVGGGFAGLKAARALAHKQGVEVLLIDQQNYHLFQPLLYQVATASLEQEAIAYPLRAVVQDLTNVRFRLGEVIDIDLDSKRVITPSDAIPYDKLVLATGMKTNTYGTPGVEEYAYELKELNDAVQLRSHILRCFERAAQLDTPEERAEWLTFVVVGGGATGVEFAGAMSELVTHIITRDYPEFEAEEEVRIILLEALDSLFSVYDEPNREFAKERLEAMDVDVRLNTMVSGVEQGRVLIKDDDPINARTLLWAAGVKVTPLIEKLDVEKTRRGQIKVTPMLNIPGYEDVFAVGDIAHFEQDGQALPGMAPVAMQMGNHVGKVILKQVKGQEPKGFHYFDKGKMAVIGRGVAIADVFGVNVRGVIAWLLWTGLHIYFLIGFQHRLQVMINWAFDYLFFQRKVRLILRGTENRVFPTSQQPEEDAFIPAAEATAEQIAAR